MFRTHNKRLPLIIATFGILLSMLTCGAHAGDIEKTEYDKGFGAKDAAVRASRSPRKVAEFAGELLESAKLVREDQPYQAYLFNKSYEIGMLFPEGIPFAVEAMDQLGKAQPELKGAADANLLTAMQKRYQTSSGPQRTAAASAYIDRALQVADALAAEQKYDEAVAVCEKAKAALVTSAVRHNDVLERALVFKEEQAAAKRVTALKLTLKATPHDAAMAIELVQILMLDVDAPDQALAYVDSTHDLTLKRIVPLAAKDLPALTDVESLAVGDWYRAHTAKPGKLANITAWNRANACYQHFLDVHPRSDADRLNATRAIKDAELALAKLPVVRTTRPAVPPVPPVAIDRQYTWTPLFNGRNLDGWIVDGGHAENFRVEGGAIAAAGAHAPTRSYVLTAREYSNFILRLEFQAGPNSGGGIALRAIPGESMPQPNVALFDHPLLKILDSARGNEETGTTQWVTDAMYVHPDRRAELGGPNTWNKLEVEMQNRSLKVAVNGKLILERTIAEGARFKGAIPALNRSKGRIGIQQHTNTIRYRNIEVMELPTSSSDVSGPVRVRPPDSAVSVPADAHVPAGGAVGARPGMPHAVPSASFPPGTPPTDVAGYLKQMEIDLDANGMSNGNPRRHFVLHRPISADEWPTLLAVIKDATSIQFTGASGTNDAVSTVARLAKLDTLMVGGQSVTDAGISSLRNHPTLREISLTGTRVSGACIADLASIPNLTLLSLMQTSVRGSVLKPLRQSSTLQTLNIGRNPLTDQDVADLAGHPAVVTLGLMGTRVTGACAETLVKIPLLRNIALDDTVFDDSGVLRLSQTLDVQSIGLSNTSVTRAGIAALPRFKNLESLGLNRYRFGFSEADMISISACSRLTSLDLGGGDLSGSQLEYVSRLQNLGILRLDGGKASDAGIAHLRNLRSLWGLYLPKTGISDESLLTLQSIPSLKFINLADNTSITQAAVDVLKRNRPDVHVVGVPVAGTPAATAEKKHAGGPSRATVPDKTPLKPGKSIFDQ
jgi:Leucine-rich repeat (LRR) protein